MNAIRFFVGHPTAANLLMLLMLAIGVAALGGLRRETFPDAFPDEIEVSVVYPGATSGEVDESIVRRLDEALSGVPFLEEIRSVASENVGKTTLKMKDAGDYTRFRNEIENAVGSIDDFPAGARPPVFRKVNTWDPVFDVLVTSTTDASRLNRYCQRLRDRMLESKSISEVHIVGFSDPVMRVEVSRGGLLQYGISPATVADAIASQNVEMPAGKIDGAESTLVAVRDERASASTFEDIVLTASRGGAEVSLGDVGWVIDDFDLDEDKVMSKGQRAAILKVLKSKSEDTLTVAKAATAIIEDERNQLANVELTIVNNMATLVDQRISLLVKNGAQGCALVLLTMWLFFNFRLSFWVVVSLPVSFLAAFALVPMAGLTINMLTMVALLMAIGVLMDDGIVIAENVARRRAEGESSRDAAIHGTREVAGGVISSFLTTCAVLGPLIFLTGELGKILSNLPKMLLLVLAMSLVEAFLILPAHLSHSFQGRSEGWSGRFRGWLDSRIDAVRDLVGGVVRLTVRHRYATAGTAAALLLVSLGLVASGVVKGQVFVDLEGDTVVARVLMQPGTRLDRTEQVVEQMEAALGRVNDRFRARQPDGQNLVKLTYTRFNENLDASENGQHVATVTGELLSTEVRDTRITEVLGAWQKEIGVIDDAESLTFDEPAIGPSGRAIHVKLAGLPLEELDAVSEEVQSFLRTFDGVYNVADDTRPGRREAQLALREGARGLGVTAMDLARQLRGSFEGLLADEVQIGRDSYDVEVRLASADRSNVSDLHGSWITTAAGHSIPISEVATIEWDRGWSRLGRTDTIPVINVYGSVDTAKSNAMGVLGEFMASRAVELQQRFPGLDIQLKGEAENGAETGGSLAMAAAIGCLGVFIILSYQFRSYIEPSIVMVAIPFALVGVIWGHYAFGLNLSLPSAMGYASLAGIVVNDSILLVVFLKSQLAKGVGVETAAAEASRTRFRAVLITSLTTIAGLMPLLLERSMQAQILIPIAVSIACGLLASTLLVLFVLPPLYVILNDLGLTSQVSKPIGDVSVA